MIQLRHTRSSNQIAAAMTIHNTVESEEFQTARRFIRDELPIRLQDDAFKRALGTSANPVARPMIFVGNYYEEIGIFVKYGLVDKNIACEMWCTEVLEDWKRMAPAIALLRQRGRSFGWGNFEYMVALCEAWVKRYPHGKFPKGRRPPNENRASD